MGRGLDSVEFYLKDGTSKLVDLAIANDFISIPVVTTALIRINGANFTVNVENSKGIKLIDLFSAIDKECALFVCISFLFNEPCVQVKHQSQTRTPVDDEGRASRGPLVSFIRNTAHV
jgi:hypothetical protein